MSASQNNAAEAAQSERESAGSARVAHKAAIRQAIADWRSGRAYFGNGGNYHIREQRIGHKWYGRGPVAPWNRAARKEFASCDKLHDRAFPRGAA